VSYDSSRSEITVRSDTGQLVTAATLRSDNSNRRPLTYIGNNVFSAKANGHLVVVNFGAEIAAVDGLRPDRGAEALLWRQDAADDPNNSPNPGFSGTSRLSRNPLAGNRNNNAGKLSYSTGPVASGGVCFQRGRQLVCVDPLTGAPLWERSSTPQVEIPQQADLFGDDELLFVADARLDSKADEVLVLSATDGSLLGRRKIDLTERRWATHGRRVLAWEEKNSFVTVRLHDAWDEQRALWSRQVPLRSRGAIIDGEELAIMEPTGQFTVVSLATGHVRFSVPLEPEPSLAWIQVIRSEGQYLLLASQGGAPAAPGGLTPLQIASNPQLGMHGRVYAFKRATGKLQWQSPAFVSHHWLPPDQPTESPLFLFVASRNANNKLTTAVLALDRRTGRSVYENESPGMAMTCDATADPVKHIASLVLIGQNNRAVNFQFTDQPQPPEPPAQTGEMASVSAGQPPGTADNSLGAAIDLLRNGPRILFPPAAPRPPAPARP
jgi:outer membrane protein assembly factor BamB